MNGIKSSKAITLIALVVTIVVLMILAGISIQMLKGDNGIVTKSNEAKLESRAGNVDEEVKMWKNNNKMIKTQNEVTGTSEALVSKEEMLEKLIQEGIVYEKEIDRDKEIITIGTREIPYGEEVDKRALIMLVNSGDTGFVKLPIAGEIDDSTKVDWGDGVIATGDKNIHNNKYASVIQNEGAKSKIVAASGGLSTTHTYSEKNKEYIVTITGKCTEIYNGDEINDNILEIIQWGETGLETVCLENCTKLRKIASPTEKSFEKITDFSYGFTVCEKLTSIPEDLFANCPNVTTFKGTFAGCTSLTSIPSTLFANCPNVTTFEGTFAGCTSLTSIPSTLFTNCPNVTTFYGTFWDCESLTSIPSILFANCPNVTTFEGTFAGCTSLTSIPLTLFANCLNVTNFGSTFYKCTGLTGEPIKLWERVPNGSTNEPDGGGCYYNATGLNNYENIPEYWRAPGGE